MTGHPPSGTVTFLLTDLEGSTRMWEQHPDAMRAAMVRHDGILEDAITTNGGFIFSRMGDGMAAAFATAGEAVAAAMTIQRALAAERWNTPRPLRARIGLHTDEGVVVNESYVSQPVNRAARLMAAAHGGQTVISGSTESLVRDELPERVELVDLGEHRLRDLGRPIRIYQVSQSGTQKSFPPLRSLDSFPGNLPGQPSSFIGRRSEAARVATAIKDSRVVTLTGVGGVGKTRLAMHVAADLLPLYRDGVWLVELAAIRDPDSVGEAIASVFNVATRGPDGIEAALVEVLAHKELLLVLDNCEHVLEPAANLVATIEQQCPGVVVLATSREGLAIDGEQLLPVPPLKVASGDEPVDRLLENDSVRLFVERARRVQPEFTLTKENSKAVVEICRRLDGVPLAIELAAARVIALSPSELARRLDRRFQVLAGGRRGAVERHATLRAAIDWSYELLNTAEQRLLARVSVFTGGATMEAIEEICGVEPVERDDVIDLVTSLVSRSLVIAEGGRSGTRYRVLETIRQYGEERLAEWDEIGPLHARHATYYADLCSVAIESSYGPDQLAWLRAVQVEQDNVRAALAYAIDSADAALAVKLVACHPHRQSQSGYPMGVVLSIPATRVLALPGADEQPEYARVLVVAAHQEIYSGDYDRAHELCAQALAAEQNLPAARHGPRIEMDDCILKAAAALWSGIYEEGAAIYARAAEIASEDGYPGVAAMLLSYSVNSDLLGGDTSDEVIAKAEEAVRLARVSAMPSAAVTAGNSLALALAVEDPERARALLRESLRLAVSPGEEIWGGLMTASMVSGRLRNWDLTLALAGRSIGLDRWNTASANLATILAACARAFAESQPEVAGVTLGAAYSAFTQADRRMRRSGPTKEAPGGSRRNFVLAGLRETAEIVAAALGDGRLHELRDIGAGMSTDDAAAYTLAHIDPKLLSGPLPDVQPQVSNIDG